MLTNLSQKKTLELSIRRLNELEKLVGLIKFKNTGVFFTTRFGVHSFFLKETIEVIILDNNNAVKLIKSLNPNRIFIWNPLFTKVLELPKGSIKVLNLKLGDILKFN